MACMASQQKASRYIEAVGRRKTAVARVRLFASSRSSFVVNGMLLEEYFPVELWQHVVQAPFAVVREQHNQPYRVSVVVRGSGKSAQAQAIRHGIARALEKAEASLRPLLKKAGLLKRDPRAKERRKFGLKKARKAPQWSKR